MSFKDVIRQDIKSVFLNFDEFGEMHKLNGKERLVIVDENELTEREKRVKDEGNGLFAKQLLFYIAAEDFGALPSPGKVLNFDGKQYLITDANNEDGIYSISLEATRS
ncbi:MAG: hypothetical protein J6C19_05715 [Lachnospiraceae bacterium]|nr:hypothetical protein [Lachnospiraceae bacterium]